ncbi:hypothetical protein TRFO_16356 [Tritrichomonas foetus]|uniref:Uncharacterized protein n=1 Tax=Tritrichomonas foetus TaxID=1144522 RepID=A0A1J4KVE6_9EUKA|nr:hypothetical protein TRFO_16356 [Tritrichomonas foetus]|eukprot:OHT13485.1 hypothetical protein TRFO_16356 [Tritrichomonas foetus]
MTENEYHDVSVKELDYNKLVRPILALEEQDQLQCLMPCDVSIKIDFGWSNIKSCALVRRFNPKKMYINDYDMFYRFENGRDKYIVLCGENYLILFQSLGIYGNKRKKKVNKYTIETLNQHLIQQNHLQNYMHFKQKCRIDIEKLSKSILQIENQTSSEDKTSREDQPKGLFYYQSSSLTVNKFIRLVMDVVIACYIKHLHYNNRSDRFLSSKYFIFEEYPKDNFKVIEQFDEFTHFVLNTKDGRSFIIKIIQTEEKFQEMKEIHIKLKDYPYFIRCYGYIEKYPTQNCFGLL